MLRICQIFTIISFLCFFSLSLTLFHLSGQQMPLTPAKLQGCNNVFIPEKNNVLYDHKTCLFLDDKGDEYKLNYSTESFNKMILEPKGKAFMVEEHFFSNERNFMFWGMFISLFIFMMTFDKSVGIGSTGIDNNRRDSSGGSDHPHSYSPHDTGDSSDSGGNSGD